ncbi:MAG TPA: EAL domain-containing protein [Steroidobacteraceae bacterium]|nr:EAL domain-containing protein [Steroidobacteraceae bacterium]
MLQKFRAARAAANKPAAPAPTLAPPPAGPATVESLGQQLREVLPTRRLQSVSLCDHEANVLWLSEGALGPDEHMLVLEALDTLNSDASLPCHETALEDGRLAVFLPVRAPMGNLVGVAMILADSKSVGDDTLERMTAAPVRTIMQRLAVLLKPSGALHGALPPIEVLEDSEPEPEEVAEAPEVAAAPEEAPEPAEASAPPVELALVTEAEVDVEVGRPAVLPAPPAQPEVDDDLSETIISAEEIANILELELVPEDVSPPAAAEPAAAPPQAKGAAKPAAPAPAPVAEEFGVADSGMLKLEFLAEPPVVRPAQNPSAVAKKLHAASKAAEVAPTRGPRPLPTPAAKAPAARAPAAPAPAPNGRAAVPAVKAGPATAPATGNGAAAGARPGPARHPFEPVPPHSKLSLSQSDDLVVLFDSDPVQVPSRPGAPVKAAPAAPARGAAPPAKPAAQPTRVAPARIVPPARTSPAVRTPTPARPPPAAPRSIPAARAPAPAAAPTPAPAPAPAVAAAPAPVAAPAPAPVVAPAPTPPAPVAAAVPAAPAPAASTPAAPLDLLPFAKLRAGGQTRRFQVLPRGSTTASDEQTLTQLLAWLAANRALWNSVPTSFTVNLSITSLEDERLLTKIGAALNSHGIAGETLGFEIAESLCVQQRAKVERFISQCEKLGAWIAIDDFSFDSQTLPLLRSKALRMLKLDARLTAAALRDKLSQAMVVATVQAAKVLGIHCSAKKADSHASLQYLTAIGLDYAQGAALAKTVALEAIATVPESRSGLFRQLENNE